MVTALGRKAARNYEAKPPVAILYTCMNDVKEEAIASCIGQDYPHYDLYILDDSPDLEERKRVDFVRKKYSGNGVQIYIIRRKERTGFKAGNLNNALRQLVNRYAYFCIVDADEIIPKIFLSEIVAIALGNKDLGFVQAAHSQYGKTVYSKQTGDSIDLHWSYFLPARNLFGFVYSYGHGVLFSSNALMRIGGFPESVSEDIAVSTKLREAGYQGYFAYDIKSYEETPPTYQSFRRKNRKIVSGTLDFFREFYPSFFQSHNITLLEKIDLFIALSVIYLPVLFVGLLTVLYGILPILLKFDYSQSIHLQQFQIPIQIFRPLQNWDSIAFLLFTVFAPLCYLIPNAIHSPVKVIFYTLRIGTIHLSICLHTVRTVLKWAITRKSSFTATGDRTYQTTISFDNIMEGLFGICVIIAGYLLGSICLIAVGFSLALVPILVKNNLEGKFTPLLITLPLLATIINIVGAPALLVSAAGIFANAALVHH